MLVTVELHKINALEENAAKAECSSYSGVKELFLSVAPYCLVGQVATVLRYSVPVC